MSENRSQKTLKLSVASVAVLSVMAAASVPAAQAGGFALREQSAIGQGSSFAGVAAGGALSSAFWNPATLTQIDGVNTESVLTAVIPKTDVSLLSGPYGTADPGDVGLDALIPASYSAMQLMNDLYVGLSVNAPYGMATKAKNPSGSAYHAATSEIFTTDAKANIAYRISDAFSVGVGVGVTYAKVRMTAAQVGVYDHELKGDAWAPTFSLGATFKPFEGTTIGVGYRSETNLKLSGTQYLTSVGSARTPITADLNLPSSITVGLRQDISKRFALLAGFEWSDWSTLKDPIVINGSLAGTTLHFGYEDGWFASLGGEYAYDDNLMLRAGVGYEKSPIPTEHRNLRLPDADRVWASLGASYNVSEKLSVDVGYSHLFIKDDVQVSGSNGLGSYTGRADSSADIISASLRYQWHPAPLFAGDEPFERKY
ncbi:OmpP1/FadL family transporter [Cohaesibacter celericrescens]|uniref:Aromatic hydrocarbon degradation protein n=1 Tax=Cohaesibacter celericrescens TaxID=2067669 RepID=A0A2N5XWS1_9HYPH|nr:outer membrane protein transport protein [Cohaesibacter celericrescens]PLW75468.1 hypothetical protein C0081_19175 [Cohaesibacter celericrescens]PLW78875.1 hypothetical protein C0081_01135 [Cohaesibacter celericrescens]